jgi:hypothetical protein
MIADGVTKGLLKARHDQFIDICDGLAPDEASGSA